MRLPQISWPLAIPLISFSFINPEISWAICLGLLLWKSLKTRRAFSGLLIGLRQVKFFLLIPFIGIIQANGHAGRDIIRDIWTFSFPILPFLLGWMCSLNEKRELALRTVMIISLLLCSHFLIRNITTFSELSINEQYIYRIEIGGLDVLVILNCMLALDVISSNWARKNKNQHLAFLSLIVSLFTVLLFSSRTFYGILGIIIFFIWIPSLLTTTKRLYWTGLVSISIVVIFGGFAVTSNIAQTDTFSGRMLDSIREISATNFDSSDDVNARFRSYETVKAIQTYIEGNPIQLAVGHGLGALVDLEFLVDLGTDKSDLQKYQFIPVLHNGYMYLLVKTGLLGLIIFFIQILKLWQALRISARTNTDQTMIHLGRTIILSTLFSTFVIAGPYNKGSWFSAMLLLGLAIGSLRKTENHQFTNVQVNT